jgi:hypothetical protein
MAATVTIQYQGVSSYSVDDTLHQIAKDHKGRCTASGYSVLDDMRDLRFEFRDYGDARGFEKSINVLHPEMMTICLR